MANRRELPKTPLARAVEAKKWTIKKLAADIGINYRTFFAYVHGDRNPKARAKRQIAAYFGTTVGALFPEEGEHEPQSAA